MLLEGSHATLILGLDSTIYCGAPQEYIEVDVFDKTYTKPGEASTGASLLLAIPL